MEGRKRSVMVRLSRKGREGSGELRPGCRGKERRGVERWFQEWCGLAVQARRGLAWRGEAWFVTARLSGPIMERAGEARRAAAWLSRKGMVGRGQARSGRIWLSWHDSAAHGRSGHDGARLSRKGEAWRALEGQGCQGRDSNG